MSAKNNVIKVDLSFRTVVYTFLFLVGMYLLFLLKDLVLGLFISLLIATGLNPTVTRMERYRIPRALAILFLYVIIVLIISLMLATVIPILLVQTGNLLDSLPLDHISARFKELEVSLENVQFISSQIGSVGPVFKVISSTFSGMITFFTFAVITFYLLMERKHLHKHLARLSPNAQVEEQVERLIYSIEKQIGGWVRGQFVLMLAVGVVTYIGLSLLNISYALPLSIIAGMLELIPNIGPTVSSIPAIIVPIVVDNNPLMAIFVAALYILVQQLENNLLVPRIMQSAVGIHPLITILSIIIGLQLAGVVGAILAVPLYLVAKVFWLELIWPKYKQS